MFVDPMLGILGFGVTTGGVAIGGWAVAKDLDRHSEHGTVL